jgi:hypothetical protein
MRPKSGPRWASPSFRPALSRPQSLQGSQHLGDPDKVRCPCEVIRQRRETELSPHFLQTPHQEVALVHPLLDAAERVLDGLAPHPEYLGPRRQTFGHAVEHRLIGPTADPSISIRGATRFERAGPTSTGVAVIDQGVPLDLPVVAGFETLSAGAKIGVAARVVAKLFLAEQAIANRRPALWSSDIGVGYLPVPMVTEPVLVAARAEINTFVVPSHSRAVHFILSAIPRGGFSGGIAIHESGDALGVITSELLSEDGTDKVRFFTVLSIEEIVKCLEAHHLLPELQRQHRAELMRISSESRLPPKE